MSFESHQLPETVIKNLKVAHRVRKSLNDAKDFASVQPK